VKFRTAALARELIVPGAAVTDLRRDSSTE
jgi:hypothetical protein